MQPIKEQIQMYLLDRTLKVVEYGISLASLLGSSHNFLPQQQKVFRLFCTVLLHNPTLDQCQS